MCRGKPIHWHIDNLTEAGHVLGAWTIVGGDECQLVASLAHLPVPLDGFGNSDCRNCRSHLLHWPGNSCPFRKSGTNALMMEAGQDRDTNNGAEMLDGSTPRRILCEARCLCARL
jgi:Uri superfamily endonuclease